MNPRTQKKRSKMFFCLFQKNSKRQKVKKTKKRFREHSISTTQNITVIAALHRNRNSSFKIFQKFPKELILIVESLNQTYST